MRCAKIYLHGVCSLLRNAARWLFKKVTKSLTRRVMIICSAKLVFNIPCWCFLVEITGIRVHVLVASLTPVLLSNFSTNEIFQDPKSDLSCNTIYGMTSCNLQKQRLFFIVTVLY
ncbi:unnamed protein product [Moneuplotes crassus]|uniref:Uncharacterized protein n=1 Tax=Euplotes crassus TaxID=5936 RepID=A0AAD2D8J3_EUPCR|nr:unnamed protein product [Moneuplotes crassus]